jgi:hypothetical protein
MRRGITTSPPSARDRDPALSLLGDAPLLAFVTDWTAAEACPETPDPEADAVSPPEPEALVPFVVVDDFEFLSANVGKVMSLSA